MRQPLPLGDPLPNRLTIGKLRGLQQISDETGIYAMCAISEDSKMLATGSGDNTAKVWDVVTGAELQTLPGNSGGVPSVSFDPKTGGHLVVGSTDGTVRVFLLRIEDLIVLAQSRTTRELLQWECLKFLHLQECPPHN